MGAKRVKDVLGALLVGDGLVSAVFPQRHVALWRVGPQSWRDAMTAFLKRPGITIVAGLIEVGLGFWLVSRQEP